MSHYVAYYENQSGTGGVRNVFAGSRWQRGSGIGSFFAGLARSVLPLFTRGLRAVGKEALRGGINVLDDIGNNINFKESVKNRFTESRDNLTEKAKNKLNNMMMMNGSGYKSVALNTALQSLKRRSTDSIAQSLVPLKKRRKRRRRKTTTSNRKKSRSTRSAGKKKRRRRRTGGVTKKKKTQRRKRKAPRKKSSNDIFG